MARLRRNHIEGSIIFDNCTDTIAIEKEFTSASLKTYIWYQPRSKTFCAKESALMPHDIRKADKNEELLLFKAIAKNGYAWDDENYCLIKLD